MLKNKEGWLCGEESGVGSRGIQDTSEDGGRARIVEWGKGATEGQGPLRVKMRRDTGKLPLSPTCHCVPRLKLRSPRK